MKITRGSKNIFKDIGCKNPEKLLKEANIKLTIRKLKEDNKYLKDTIKNLAVEHSKLMVEVYKLNKELNISRLDER